MRGYALGALLKELNDSEWVDASPASGQFITFRFHYNPLKVCSGPVAHLGEHPPCKRKVAGSIPVWSTILLHTLIYILMCICYTFCTERRQIKGE